MKTLLHVNYFEGPKKLDELFRVADKFGYDGVELRWKYRFDDMNQQEYQNKVVELKSKYPDFEITFGGNIEFCRGKEEEIKKDTADYLEFLEWSKNELDTKVMNFFTGTMVEEGVDYCEFHRNGSAMADEGDYERSAAGLKVIGEKAVELDMLISLETHNCYIHDLAKPCKKLLDMTDHEAIGINWDQGNIMINMHGESIDDVFDILDGKIYYAHLKNLMAFRHQFFIATHLNQGHIDTRYALEKLKNNLKSGILAVEYPCSGDGIIAAKKDIEYVNFLKDWLEI